MKALFICAINKHRSVAAEEEFVDLFETRSRGLYGGNLLTESDIEWAEVTFIMEEEMRAEIISRFASAKEKKIFCLNIDGSYVYSSPDLRLRMRQKVQSLIDEGLIRLY